MRLVQNPATGGWFAASVEERTPTDTSEDLRMYLDPVTDKYYMAPAGLPPSSHTTPTSRQQHPQTHVRSTRIKSERPSQSPSPQKHPVDAEMLQQPVQQQTSGLSASRTSQHLGLNRLSTQASHSPKMPATLTGSQPAVRGPDRAWPISEPFRFKRARTAPPHFLLGKQEDADASMVAAAASKSTQPASDIDAEPTKEEN